MNKKWQSLILGIMCLVLTIGICVQVKTVNSNGTTIGDNPELGELKNQVLKMKEKYEFAYERLEIAEKELERVRESVTSNDESLKKLEEEIKKANMSLGLADVSGKGVTITVSDGNNNSLLALYSANDLLIHNTDLLEIVNELNNSGAEAIEINGQRIVSTTSIICDGNVISINGIKTTSPFTINAIGLPELMATLKRPGGYLAILSDHGLPPTFQKQDKITIPKYSGVINFKYAKTSK